MIKRIEALFVRYKSILLYLFFGVCTTLVNLVSYYICARMLAIGTMPSTVIAWIAAVLFAYVTNRKWVFVSQETTAKGIFKEMVRFFGCRISTGVVDWLCMFVFVDLLAWNDMLIKFGANVLVIVLNYLASRLIIFKSKQ